MKKEWKKEIKNHRRRIAILGIGAAAVIGLLIGIGGWKSTGTLGSEESSPYDNSSYDSSLYDDSSYDSSAWISDDFSTPGEEQVSAEDTDIGVAAVDSSQTADVSVDFGITEKAAASGASDASETSEQSGTDISEKDNGAETADQSDRDASGETDGYEQKLVTTWDLYMETENYEEIMAQLKDSLEKAGGYIESENENSGYSGVRCCSLTIRVPQDQADSWVEGMDNLGTITSRTMSQEDVTLSYVDMESRLSTLRTEQESLTELLAQAENVEDIITIRQQLTDVNYQIESYESQLRLLENQVSYSTVNLTLCEVTREVVTDDSIGARISETFRSNLESIGAFFTGLIVGLAGYSLTIILAAVFLLLLILIIRYLMKKGRIRRKRADGKQENEGRTGDQEFSEIPEERHTGKPEQEDMAEERTVGELTKKDMEEERTAEEPTKKDMAEERRTEEPSREAATEEKNGRGADA